MEMANLEKQHLRVRRAKERDLPFIAEMIHHSPYNHIHVDWRVPRYWFDHGSFVVAESTPDGDKGADGIMQGCLAVGADPPPAAWVRVAAVRGRRLAVELLAAMLSEMAPVLAQSGVSKVAWLPRRRWPEAWLEALGFEHIDEVVTYVKPDLEIPLDVRDNEAVRVRKVRDKDMARLAAIEEAAFDPLWRHSMESLRIGRQHSLSFHVAEVDGRVVGFQYSSDSDVQQAGHLVRLTVAPEAQRMGVGSLLLQAALESYREHSLQEASLNTQLSNAPSRRLYEKFGFKPAGYHWPVWARRIDENIDLSLHGNEEVYDGS